MTIKYRRPKLSDPGVDIKTAIRMQEDLERLVNMTFTSDFTLFTHPVFMIGMRRRPDIFPWDKCQFGWETVTGSPLKINILSGNITKLTYESVTVPDTEVTIGASNTYVGVQVSRALSSPSIITGTSLAQMTTNDDWARTWFYIFNGASGIATLVRYNLAHIGDFDISAYGD